MYGVCCGSGSGEEWRVVGQTDHEEVVGDAFGRHGGGGARGHFMVCYWWHKDGKEGEERKERRSTLFRLCYVGTLAHIEKGNEVKCE